MREAPSAAALAEGVLAGRRAVVARALTLVESSRADHRAVAHELLELLAPHTGQAIRVGISGVPGAGKSTFIDALGTRLIEQGHRVGVLAVDPSSSRSGGSILGDRTRMAALTASEDAFVRPSPSGCHLGGVARATREAMVVLEAAAFDVLIVETVGVGQSEVAVAGMVDTFLLLALARSGDQLQGIKRGILELADVIAVNKADGDNLGESRVTARELAIAMKLMFSEDDGAPPQVLTCSARTGDGLPEVWQAVLDHRNQLLASGQLQQRRLDQQKQWMWALVEDGLWRDFRDNPVLQQASPQIEQALAAGELGALEAAEQLLSLSRKRASTTPTADA
ncbi:methylmalonyl Co-A mutase-associated GTPase MeaB [Yimella sp. cx-51]|uniref:methylmalonyl Co-A mutase-associated GTPase MeaB n=1 Tax=Yimella sp. cx-51 TaxID=2770551 RepID=UPI00165E2E1E|nr:methylmalonyl Co-A mutase-associated GTPase MeaB [Yimella sp. cx-51]MBC9956165.1 methylmalonyl Co-A mutase-associated GTPase MeaB [Yimella sp. cx-51]QTH38680.1 methylmalonyl Co-A mutase-associated GTPase MeaB [Yimella sp. cx-51]